MRYNPWGEVRYTWTTSLSTTPAYQLTRYTYTGQYSNVPDFGLMFYNARWYDPYITHFSQPDSIIPNPGNVLDWNRYSYARYNPLKYTDPSGHFSQDELVKMWGFKDKKDAGFQKLWNKWEKSGFRDVLLSAKWGDILTFKMVGVTFSLMFGQMKDGTLGFWCTNDKNYYDRAFGEWAFESSESWALFTRDTSQDPYAGHDFDTYTPTSWKEGETLPIPDLDYYWAGGADNNPSYVEIYTNINIGTLIQDLAYIASPFAMTYIGYKAGIGYNPITDKVGWATGGAMPLFILGWAGIWESNFVENRIPKIHP